MDVERMIIINPSIARRLKFLLIIPLILIGLFLKFEPITITAFCYIFLGIMIYIDFLEETNKIVRIVMATIGFIIAGFGVLILLLKL
jgi:hypothetical protein